MKRIQGWLLLLYVAMIYNIHATANIERTFAMIKPHAVKEGKTREIMSMIQSAGFNIVVSKQIKLTEVLMAQLYNDYKLRLWFRKYIKSMSEKIAVVMILEKKDAVRQWDKYKKVIRQHYGLFTHKNAVHGSDTLQDAKREIAIFFPDSTK
jgi:nucleoside-diphosphate kinase